VRYEDQPLCETCQARYPDAGIRHPSDHVRDAPRPAWLGVLLLVLAAYNLWRDLWWVAIPVALAGIFLLWLAGSILHHELVDRPRFRRSRQG
jgi:fatty acid desaturase